MGTKTIVLVREGASCAPYAYGPFDSEHEAFLRLRDEADPFNILGATILTGSNVAALQELFRDNLGPGATIALVPMTR